MFVYIVLLLEGLRECGLLFCEIVGVVMLGVILGCR